MALQLPLAVLGGVSLALASSAHCAVMCGPLALATRLHNGPGARLSYFFGRLVSYSLIGVLVGSLGRVLLASVWARGVEAVLSWSLAGLLVYTALGLMRGAPRARLLQLGRGPKKSHLGALLVHVAEDPLLLGIATALLPCGVLFSAAVAAAALGSALQGGAFMGAFALVSGGVVVSVGELSTLRSLTPRLRPLLGLVLLLGAGLMIYRPLAMLRAGDGAPACHGGAAAPGAPR
jgi:sulfite exporter TauE/SafE